MVIGRPVNTLSKLLTLNLASLKAPDNTNIRERRYPINPKCIKLIFHVITTGATPKEIKSERESSSFPKSLVTLKNLATLPSNLSVTAAIIISRQEYIITEEEPLIASKIATIPRDKFVEVIILGI